MHLLRRFLSSALAAALIAMPLYAVPQPPGSGGDGNQDVDIHHVLVISVDGLHALDLTNYVSSHPNSTLAAFRDHGVIYTNESTSQPSDSFPGLASLVTGGTPPPLAFGTTLPTIAFCLRLHKPRRCPLPAARPLPQRCRHADGLRRID